MVEAKKKKKGKMEMETLQMDKTTLAAVLS
jgi:hypothetical protein